MYMRKNKWNWMAALLMIVVGMSSCSSEEELEVEVDEPLPANQALFSSDAYSIGYSLSNERGDRTTTLRRVRISSSTSPSLMPQGINFTWQMNVIS